MSWLSKKVDKAKKDGISISKTWKNDGVNKITRWVTRVVGRGTLFICENCHGEWNVYGPITYLPGVAQKVKNGIYHRITCPYCDGFSVRPKGV